MPKEGIMISLLASKEMDGFSLNGLTVKEAIAHSEAIVSPKKASAV